MLHLQSSSFCFEDLFENLFIYKSISSYYFSQCFLYSGCLPDAATFSIYFPNISLRATHLENRKKINGYDDYLTLYHFQHIWKK